MITKRIIPCLDVRNGRVVKGTNFEGIRDVADPVEMARMYNAAGADELVFYDITASFEGRALFTDILTRVASEIFIPLTVGGGINTPDDFDRVLKCGADKVSVNSGAIRNPGIIPAAAQKYGNQCVVLSADIKRVDGKFMLFAKGGRENTGIDALEKKLLAQNAEHKDWACTEEMMKLTKDGKALYLHCLPADISGLSCPEGEVDNSVFDRYIVPLYKQASYKPYIIAAMIFLAQVKDPVRALMEMDKSDAERKMF